MSSLRGQLTLALCGLAALLLPLISALVFFGARALLVSDEERALQAKAEAVIHATEWDKGELEVDEEILAFADLSNSRRDLYAIRTQEGQWISRSWSLRDEDLTHPTPILGRAQFAIIPLSDGRKARMLYQSFQVRDAPPGASPPQLYLLRASEGLDGTLHSLALVLIASSVLGLAVTLATLWWLLNRGLRPLSEMATAVERLKVGKPDQHLETTLLPDELRSIGLKLNEYMDRVEASLARERRFSNHAAHELRTPLAEIRAMSELIAKWPEEYTQGHHEEILSVVKEMDLLLQRLALLARSDAQELQVNLEPLSLTEAIPPIVSRHQGQAEERGLRLRTEIAEETLQTDPALFGIILNNLLGNAVSHAPEQDEILIEAGKDFLRVTNSAPDLSPDDLPKLFERFWRKNTARHTESHSGLGLAIVTACCESLGAKCEADFVDDNRLCLEVKWLSEVK